MRLQSKQYQGSEIIRIHGNQAIYPPARAQTTKELRIRWPLTSHPACGQSLPTNGRGSYSCLIESLNLIASK